ncbi:MAG TPA: hypothetical protein VL172_11400 [Kofleriaceae bacterium]|nr:hypothetical protein [Kofleriaceae bacterium]
MTRTILLLSLLAACGGGTAGGDDDTTPDAGSLPQGSLFPLVIDATWTYQVTDVSTNVVEQKSQTVEALEDVGGDKAGITAYRLRTEKAGGGYTISWQEDTGDAVIRHREQNFDSLDAMQMDSYFVPSKLRVDQSDAHVADGAAWDDSYQEQNHDIVAGTTITADKVDHWTVMASVESVTVPAGTFTALHVHRTNSVTFSDKQYWFVPGVGKVKETGDSQIELLSDYTIP